jgi:hypothetical protein
MLSNKTARALREVLRVHSRTKRLRDALHIVEFEGGVYTDDLKPGYDVLRELNANLASSPIVKAAEAMKD